jgi:Uma2 family endonuclease
VDNEEQNLLPNLLLMLLTQLWADRMDWFFGVDMAVYHTTGLNSRVPVVPDAFLSLGVERRKGDDMRRSYVVWEEHEIVPVLALEMVSHQPGGEYDDKMEIYSKLGVLYYVVYNPKYWGRDRHQPLEVYKLEASTYQLQRGEPFWMPEVGLSIGRYNTQWGNLPQEILTWYDERGTRHLSEAEQERMRAEQEQMRAERAEVLAKQARSRAEQLEAILRARGIDPDELS